MVTWLDRFSGWLLAAATALAVAGCGGGSAPAAGAASGSPQRLLSATLADFKGNGTWWNPAEPGTGFVFEAQGGTGVITYFVYEASGKSVWYSGAGTFTLRADGKYAFAASLFRYSGGQPATSTTPSTPQRVFVGDTSVVFDGNSAQVTVPGRSYAATKFNPSTAESGAQPEAGIYWNAAESGRGYTIEVANNIASIGVFHYDSAGEPTWNLIVGDISTGRLQSAFTSYTGGQTLGGSYRAAQAVNTSAQFQADFVTACNGTIQFPGMGSVAVSRFPFGGLAAGSECRSASPRVVATSCTVTTGFSSNFETTLADAGFAGAGTGGGGDGGGGGAAAGGGLGKVLGGLMRVTDLSDGSVVGEALTDSTSGLVTIRTCGRAGPFLVRLEGRAGAKYFDEGLNQLTDFGAGNVLHALVDKWDEHVGVSPITEAAYRFALNYIKINPSDVAEGRTPLRAAGSLVGLTKAQVASANKVVQDEVNRRFTTNYQLVSAKALPTPVDATSPSNAMNDNRYGRSAAVNGGLVQAAQYYNPAIAQPALAFADQLARDLTDGLINGFALDGSQVAPADKTSYESVRLPLGGTIATNAVTRRFAASTLLPGELRLEESSLVSANGITANGVFNAYDTTQVSCSGFQDSAALMSDGSVTVRRRFPTQTAGVCKYLFNAAENARIVTIKNFLTNIKTLSRGGSRGYAVKTDGTVHGWGDNYCGQLSPYLPNNTLYAQPQLIPELKDVTAFANAASGSIARDRAGVIYTWGAASGGPPSGRPSAACGTNIGFGGAPNFTVYQPTTIEKESSINNVAEVYVESGNYFALTTSGVLYGWGDGFAGLLANSDGSLILNTYLQGVTYAKPTPIEGLSGVRSLAFTELTAYALLRDGTVKAWGNDSRKLLGNGTQKRTVRPTTIAGLSNLAHIQGAVGGLRLLRNDGVALAWGESIGSGGPSTNITSYVPIVIPNSDPVRHFISGGGNGFFTVFFASGKVGSDLDSTTDVTPQYR